MYFYENMRCPVCGQPFEPKDDVVVCPVCGLPHHRACWQKEGHCHLAHLHGTAAQWSRETAEPDKDATSEGNRPDGGEQICPRCQARNPEFAEFCCRCGYPFGAADWDDNTTNSADTSQQPPCCEYMPFRSAYADATDYNPNEVIGTQKASDFAAVTGSRVDYYLPRFRRIANGGSGGWNWAAFLLGPYWLLFRKMYWAGGFLLFLQFLQSCVLNLIMVQLNLTDTAGLVRFLSRDFQSKQELYYYLALLMLTVLVYFIRFALGIFGNLLYYRHSNSLINRKRSQIPDVTAAELSTAGGTSFSILVIGYIGVNVLSMLLQLLL